MTLFDDDIPLTDAVPAPDKPDVPAESPTMRAIAILSRLTGPERVEALAEFMGAIQAGSLAAAVSRRERPCEYLRRSVSDERI